LGNARGRNRRNAQRQARRRREKLLNELSLLGGSVGVGDFGLVTAEESLELLTAHLHRARSITKRLTRALRIGRRASDAPQSASCDPPLPRPTRVLREANRSVIFPQLLSGATAPHRADSFSELIRFLREMPAREMSPHAMLDFLARSSGLPWPVAAKVLHAERLIPAEFSATDIDAIRGARTFWNRYEDGRIAYRGCLDAGEIKPVEGDWAFFESDELQALLPGVAMPRMFRRNSYLTNLVRNSEGLCLDLHSRNGSPFGRHTF
jgi:hypothetical protein